MKRYLENQVRSDLEQKMVFIGGPRQVGKTTLARSIAPKEGYLNWDFAEDRERILRNDLPASSVLIFDEIHKYKRWRNHLKGLYDKNKPHLKILVTGSARLDLYRRGGDSLQGRRLEAQGVHRMQALRQIRIEFAPISAQEVSPCSGLSNHSGRRRELSN